MNKEQGGITVYIYHHPLWDCTNNGISSKHNEALLIGDGIPEQTEQSEERPTFKLVERVIQGEQYLHVEPVTPGHYMFGGNICSCSDSRFPSRYPLKIHDRQEH